MRKEVFDDLFSVNCNGHTEKKKSGNVELTYLSWPFAVAEVLKRYPDMTYQVMEDSNGMPFFFDKSLGYMVKTSVTIDGDTKMMWLPVMDSHNAAMKDEPYDVKTKYSSYTVPAATMFDINKSIMRCLVKNFAMFGLGLYIYAGEDLPEDDEAVDRKANKKKPDGNAVSESKKGISSSPDVSDDKITAEESRQIIEMIRNMYEDNDTRNKVYKKVLAEVGLASNGIMSMKKEDYGKVMTRIMELSAESDIA